MPKLCHVLQKKKSDCEDLLVLNRERGEYVGYLKGEIEFGDRVIDGCIASSVSPEAVAANDKILKEIVGNIVELVKKLMSWDTR